MVNSIQPERLSAIRGGIWLLAVCLTGCCLQVQDPSCTDLTDETVRNSIGMTFRRVPAGSGWVGSPKSELGRVAYLDTHFITRSSLGPQESGPEPRRMYSIDWEPRRQVTFSDAYYIGVTEVTNRQYRLFRRAHASEIVAQDPNEFPDGVEYNLTQAALSKISPEDYSGDDFPVNCVARTDANAFCVWLTNRREEKAAGRQYRLPTEDEWEYACRGGSGSAFFWGNDPNSACDYANLADESGDGLWRGRYPVHCNDGCIGPSPTGVFRPNRFGLRDTLGNVWEICLGGVTATIGGERFWMSDLVSRGPAVPIRGGSWGSNWLGARCAARMHVSHVTRSPLIGFRVVLEARSDKVEHPTTSQCEDVRNPGPGDALGSSIGVSP